MIKSIINRIASRYGWECGDSDASRPGLGIWHDLEQDVWFFSLGRFGFSLERSAESRAQIRDQILSGWKGGKSARRSA